jgi:calcium-binding protein CML
MPWFTLSPCTSRCGWRNAQVVAMERSIVSALQHKKRELESEKIASPNFESLLVRLDVVKGVLAIIKRTFGSIDLDGSKKLDRDELRCALRELEVQMSCEDMNTLFSICDFDKLHELTYRQFFVLCVVGHLLELMPSLAQLNACSVDGREERTIASIIDLLVSSYLMFDPTCKGYIRKSEVVQLTEKKGASQSFLTKERWVEMDWDSNGTVDFTEFLFAVISWIDPDDEDEESEDSREKS